MDEKTAPIPSLKDFSEQRKERSAQTNRTSTMQTKGQQRRSAQLRETPKKKKTPAPSSKTGQNSAKKTSASSNRRPASTTQKHKTSSGAATSRKQSSAPHTYARERNAHNTAINSAGEVTRSTSSTESKYNFDRFAEYDRPGVGGSKTENHRASSTQRRRPSSEPTGRRPASNSQPQRTQRKNNSQKKSAKSSVAPASKTAQKKPRKPLSPRARKFRNFFIYLGLFLCVMLVGVILSLTVMFKTEQIIVNGSGDYLEQDIIAESGLIIGDNIFTSPKGRAEDKLESAFPYIEKADVYSVFPNTINIDITLAEAACVVDGMNGYYIVSDKGKVLEVSATVDELEVPVVEGIKAGGKVAGDFIDYDSEVVSLALQEIFSTLSELDAESITLVNVSTENDTVELKYVYDNRIVVYLGIPEHLAYKVRTAQTIIKEKLEVSGTMIAGDLDVSMCYDTSKSYFNQYSLLTDNVTAHEETAEPTEETITVQY